MEKRKLKRITIISIILRSDVRAFKVLGMKLSLLLTFLADWLCSLILAGKLNINNSLTNALMPFVDEDYVM